MYFLQHRNLGTAIIVTMAPPPEKKETTEKQFILPSEVGIIKLCEKADALKVSNSPHSPTKYCSSSSSINTACTSSTVADFPNSTTKMHEYQAKASSFYKNTKQSILSKKQSTESLVTNAFGKNNIRSPVVSPVTSPSTTYDTDLIQDIDDTDDDDDDDDNNNLVVQVSDSREDNQNSVSIPNPLTINFLTNPLSSVSSSLVECILRVSSGGKYSLLAEGGVAFESEQLLLTTHRENYFKKLSGLSLTINGGTSAKSVLGKLKGSYTGSKFKLESMASTNSSTVVIEYGMTRLQGVPREMNVCIITNANDVSEFHTQEPEWNEEINSYSLDFGSRVEEPDASNFILLDERENVVMRFGKKSVKRNYTCDFSAPLSPIQAMAIAISAVHPKLVCE